MHMRSRATKAVALSGIVASVVAVSSCGTDDSTESAAPAHGAEPIALTYDGGIYVLDPTTLAKTGEVQLEGFNRLNPAGDDRHLMVTVKDGFRVFDPATAEFTGTEFPAGKPGHVVRHAGRTVLFADATGEVTAFESAALESGKKPATEVYRTPTPHHGVAVQLANGNLLVTLGTDEKRVGAVVLDAQRKEIARNEDCPGVHGEAAAKDEAIVIGCQTGVLVYRNGAITKVTSPTPYGRIGNAAGSDVSPIVLGDYKQDKDAELERPQQISLIDTVSGSLRLVDIGTSYTFRSLARGPQGEALVLGTDGRLHVIDPVAGTITRSIPVLAPWQEPLKWQDPRPTLFSRDGMAYVSDPATKQVHRIDLSTGAVAASATLAATPNELSGVIGH
ncbi:zinc metallochaperone AztD [Nocardia sp. XZ_19_369]|uniref:zinc metallochaperone AztD n=1 Tax=Nocardia sp. XZ_19_369 TaxID=2769487 RepID=UPI00188F39FF|nr:zinc metallochaperone AztD [Nocardia sp. XZ_19_369]